MAVAVATAIMPALTFLIFLSIGCEAIAGHWGRGSGARDVTTFFTHADGAALPVLSVAIDAVLVTGEGRTLDAATHLAAMLVPDISVGAGLSAAQRSALWHGHAALAHLASKIIPLVTHWALQGTVRSQVRAGVIVETLAKKTSILVLLETIGAVIH